MKRWTTGEVAKQSNISVRTLRYYDQIDLLTPSFRDSNGKRLYAEEDLFKLEKIIILKKLSLPLEDINQVLEKLTYKQILISHFNLLQEQLANLQTNISNTTSLINMLDLNEALSWEDVSEIVNRAQVNHHKKWIDYFHEGEKIFLQQTIPNLSESNEKTQGFMSLLHRIEWCIERNISPESNEGMQIVLKLIEISNDTFGEDLKLMDKFWEIRKLPAEETGLFPIADEVLQFIEHAVTCIESENA